LLLGRPAYRCSSICVDPSGRRLPVIYISSIIGIGVAYQMVIVIIQSYAITFIGDTIVFGVNEVSESACGSGPVLECQFRRILGTFVDCERYVGSGE
jgi:hypothetical protein